ncbi:MAG: N-acetylmuramoyl-L-alanine amidase [Syntrophomonas sp.]|nr:N-acetylmuramoyl-L-alanine amidase [Syntrophomonas sp.]
MARLCFDYGHGGTDPGAVYIGRKEANDVLSLGRSVAEILRRHGVVVDETRTSNTTESLNARSNFENRGAYDYFISFHRNAVQPEQAAGVETYTCINPGVKSKELAAKLQSALVGVGFKDRGVKTANFYVLRKTKAPAVLIEIGFIDNSLDNALFDSKRAEIVQAIAGAILSQLRLASAKDSLKEALDVLARNGILKSPDYWLEHARTGQNANGEYAGTLIERMAEYISSR